MRNLFKDFDKNYEPKSLEDIVFHSAEAREEVEALVDGSFGFPSTGVNAILLYGIPGTGKSALAKILPDLIERSNGGEYANVSYFEIGQGGENGAAVIEKVRAQAKLVSIGNAYHYFVLDEVDNLLPQAMLSLKSAMNIGAKNSIFVITTNNLAKIEAGVISRSTLVEFNAATSTDWLPKLRQILADYGIASFNDNTLIQIIEPCEGDARRILPAIKKLISKHVKRTA